MIAALIVIIAASLLLPRRGGAEAPDAWVVIGVILAAAAVGGTMWNGWQLYRHVNLAKRDADGRLRPVLAWTADSDRPSHTFAIVEADQITIRIINAGQVAAVGIECDARFGMEDEFKAGKAKHDKSQWGSLAPNKVLEVGVPITGTQNIQALEKKKKFHIEIAAEYRAPGGKVYRYAMRGDYDGWHVTLRD